MPKSVSPVKGEQRVTYDLFEIYSIDSYGDLQETLLNPSLEKEVREIFTEFIRKTMERTKDVTN